MRKTPSRRELLISALATATLTRVSRAQTTPKLILNQVKNDLYEIEGDVVIVRNVRSTRRLRPWEN